MPAHEAPLPGTTARRSSLKKKSIVTPGERVALTGTAEGAEGTYTVRNYIYSSVLGQIVHEPGKDDGLPTVRVQTVSGLPSAPRIGSTVIARVLRIQSRVCHCQILFTNTTATDPFLASDSPEDIKPSCFRVAHSYKAQIRLQDVRQYEVDRVNMLNCFRINDILCAKVISAGTGVFLLSTAPLDMGVVVAESYAGGVLEPISCKWMRCRTSGLLEPRKVARPPSLRPMPNER